MPAIDWTSSGFLLALASIGTGLMLLGVLFYVLPPPRSKALAIAVGILGGLALGIALGLRFVPAARPASAERAIEPSPPQPGEPVPSGNTPVWYTVRRGDVVLPLVERGVLESADSVDIVVKVGAPQAGGTAARIKTIVADGTTVKKGQLLVELDDTKLIEALRAQKRIVEEAKAELAQVQKQAVLDRERAQLDLEEARHQLSLAQRDQKAYTGSDADRKKGLELRIKEAQQLVKTRDFQNTTLQTRTEELQRAAQAIVEGETSKTKDLETEIAHCKMEAPRDGRVFYHVPPGWKGSGPILAPGKSVAEKQKLLYLPDLAKMQVHMNIPESQIGRVRLDQTAIVRVDAIPDQVLSGKVVHISETAEPRPDGGHYPVVIGLSGENRGLRPGMSAEVRMELEHRSNVLRVPLRALHPRGEKTICFVRSGAEVQERQVTIGLRDDVFAEITEGLKEGDQVLP